MEQQQQASTENTNTVVIQSKKLTIVRRQKPSQPPPSTKAPPPPPQSPTTTSTTFSLNSTPFIPSSHKPVTEKKQQQEPKPQHEEQKKKPKRNRSKKRHQKEQSPELQQRHKSPSPTQTRGINVTNVQNDNDDDRAEQTSHIKDISKQLNSNRNDPNAYLCPICMDVIKRTDDIWECHKCWNIFHISCITHWADSQRKIATAAAEPVPPPQLSIPATADSVSSVRTTNTLFDFIQIQMERQHIHIPEQGYDYTEPQSSASQSAKESALKPWTCPCCRSEHKDTPIASCFCGKCKRTKIIPLFNEPHSCGEMCGRLREGTTCPHPCTLVCHPGPCPPCPSMGSPIKCHCGKSEVVLRCGEGSNGVSCGKICGRQLSCGKHFCEEICHPGACKECAVTVEVTCYCGKETKLKSCKEVNTNGGEFSCGNVCDKVLDCGNHRCKSVCHSGACVPCQLKPEILTRCPCGKSLVADICPERRLCTDPVPTCGKTCGKKLPFCSHTCQAPCHTGECPPCTAMVTVPCRCKSTMQTVECHKTLKPDGVLCDTVCTCKLTCKRHKCGVQCCPSLNNPGGDEHICMRICGRPLACGEHTCELLCHTGRCPACTHVTYDAISCRCGRTVAQPPIPCGTILPACPYPCTIERPCGHNDRHLCHFGECPPCIALVDKMCSGGHRIMKNVPCNMESISCGATCGKVLPCGEHTCQMRCHAGDCPNWQPPKEVSWYSETRNKTKKNKKKKNNTNEITNNNNNNTNNVNNNNDNNNVNLKESIHLSCGQPCGRLKACGHKCMHMCHPGKPCPDEPCMDLVKIHCSCGTRTTEAHCFCAMDAAEKLECDDVCREIARRRTLADAFGIRPADGTVPAYSSFLIYFARAHQGYVTELESTFAEFIRDSDAKFLAIEPRLDVTTRKFVFALSKYYGLSVFTDRDQSKSFTKMSIAAPPSVLLSQVAKDEDYSNLAMNANLENTRSATPGNMSVVDQEDHSFTLHLSCDPPERLDRAAIVEVVRMFGDGSMFVSLGPCEGLITSKDMNTLGSIRMKLAPLNINIK